MTLHTWAMTTEAPSLQSYVSEEIRVALTRRRTSARYLASELGWSPAQLSRKLSNQVPLTLDDIGRIARALKVPLQSLLPADIDGV